MKSIKIGKKKIEKFNINGREMVMTLDTQTIDYIQDNFDVGFLQSIQKVRNLSMGLKLIKAMVKDAKTGELIEDEFWDELDLVPLMVELSPILEKCVASNMPKAKNKSEKK